MPIFEFTAEDLSRGLVVPPAWYRIRIGRFSEALSKKGDSTNWVYDDCKILYNADDRTTEFVDSSGKTQTLANANITLRFNSKARGFVEGFFRALGGEPEAGARMDWNAAQDKEIDVFVENDTYEGRILNKASGKFRKPRD